jgi:DNA-binding LytR/AlgR family response regulator
MPASTCHARFTTFARLFRHRWTNSIPREFVRIHRSTIVNLRRVREIQPWSQGGHIVVLHSGEELRMSLYQRAAVQRLLGK